MHAFRRIVPDVTTSKEVTHPEESAAVEHRGRLFLCLEQGGLPVRRRAADAPAIPSAEA